MYPRKIVQNAALLTPPCARTNRDPSPAPPPLRRERDRGMPPVGASKRSEQRAGLDPNRSPAACLGAAGQKIPLRNLLKIYTGRFVQGACRKAGLPWWLVS